MAQSIVGCRAGSPVRSVMRLAALVAGAVAVGSIGGDVLAAESGSRLEKRQVLRVLRMDAREGDEFFTLSTGDNPGFDREILEGFAKLHGLRLEAVTVPSWADLVPGLLEHKGDVAAGRFTITSERQKLVDFTVEVFPTRHVVMTRKPTRLVLTREELKAAKIGVVKGSAVEEAVLAAGVPRANIVHTAPSTSGTLLADRAITTVVANVESAVVAQRKDPDLQLGMFLGSAQSLAYAVRKDDPELLQALNQYIGNVRRGASWNRLVVKYFGESGLEILKRVRER